MHIREILTQRPISFSFEFFPPKSEQGADELLQTIGKLQDLNPAFVSVTYGAGGSTRELTHDLVVRIKRTTPLEAIPHLTCVGHTEEDIAGIVTRYADAGVGNILALGGDPPRDQPNYDRSADRFHHAADLVRFIRQFNDQQRHPHADGFGVGVAGFPEGHPATPNRLMELDFLKAKVDAGADYIVTQMFFDNRDFFDLCERCELAGIRVPIIAGIMPIITLGGMRRMAELAAGVRYPARLLRAIGEVEDDPARVRDVGVQWAIEQCQELIANGARGIHFYTLNKSRATLDIYRDLGLVT